MPHKVTDDSPLREDKHLSVILSAELDHIDWLHHDHMHSSLMAAAVAISIRNGYKPGRSSKDLRRYLGTSKLRPAKVLKIVADCLGCELPKDVWRVLDCS